ncbi:MAG TPA: hypothetical protein VFU23_00250 [Gemmatimonadales bacterium]|nr:hypothetical protein [Gemmatimonadales bacterium]
MDPALSNEVNSIRLTLQAVEAQVGSGKIQKGALEDLKSAVDEIRLRIWAIMSAAAETSDGLALERFRLRRAIEFCDSLNREFEAGTISSRHRECVILQTALNRLSRNLAQALPDAH